jgi:hypothetical protein
MSRGSLLLQAARSGQELIYAPILGSERRGRRAPGVSPTRRAPSSAPPPAPSAATAPAAGRLELVILVGLPGAGKSTFFRQRFAATHEHVSRDPLRALREPLRRQQELLERALAAGRSAVVDNTIVSVKDRAPLIALGRRHGARLSVYLFETGARECVARNAGREGAARIPAVGIFAAAKRLVRPAASEGFDTLFVVRPLPDLSFEVIPDPSDDPGDDPGEGE